MRARRGARSCRARCPPLPCSGCWCCCWWGSRAFGVGGGAAPAPAAPHLRGCGARAPITDPRNHAFAGSPAAPPTQHPRTRHDGRVLKSLAPARRRLVLALVAVVVLVVLVA